MRLGNKRDLKYALALGGLIVLWETCSSYSRLVVWMRYSVEDS